MRMKPIRVAIIGVGNCASGAGTGDATEPGAAPQQETPQRGSEA